jgi:hypothetical protein
MWLSNPGVEGVSRSQDDDGHDVVRVLVGNRRALDEMSARLPTSVDGFPVVIEVDGGFRAF